MNLRDKLKGEAIETAFKEFKLKAGKCLYGIRLTTGEKLNLFILKVKENKKAVAGACAGVCAVAVICTVMIANAGTDVYELSIDGKSVGYIGSREIVTEAVDAAKQELVNENKGIEIVYDDNVLACVATDLKEKEVKFLSDKQLESAIEKSDAMKAKAWAVRVEDKDLFAENTKKSAESVLDRVQKNYQTEGSQIVEAKFKEAVLVTKAAVTLDKVMGEDEAVSYLLTGTKGTKTYTVKDGDTSWDVAIANGMSFDELLAANKGVDVWKMQIGTQLNLVVPKPYLTVVLQEVVTTAQEINFETTYEDTNSLYAGQVKMKSDGVKGQKEIKTEIVKENGVQVASSEIEAKVTQEPQNAVALKGTRMIVGYNGISAGVFGSPMSNLQVSSAYGSRGGERHQGVDLRNPAGTPIYATEGGKVTFAGYSGSYGNLVKISHGGGLETYYAHCSSLFVSVGQTVAKGQQIAAVGATGNATGNHLHFEVKKNGVAQNPWSYI